MKKIITNILNYFDDYFRHREVYVHDKYYDDIYDNDDLDDLPTIVRVTYSKARGIIDVNLVGIGYFTISNEPNERYVKESPLDEYHEFCKICGINEYGGLNEYKKYSLYR